MVKKEKKVTRIDPVRTTQPLEQQSAHWRAKQLDFFRYLCG